MNNESISNEKIVSLLSDLQKSLWKYYKQHGEACPILFSGPRPTVPSQPLLNDCKLVASRIELLKRLPKNGRFAEIGVLHGNFTVKIIEIIKPVELHIFDIDLDQISPENNRKISTTNLFTHQGISWECLAKIDDNYFDITYVDADHGYEAVTRDLKEAFRTTKAGGFIVCNDYCSWSIADARPYGVLSAVNQLSIETGATFEYLALHPNGYNDVALRKR